MKNSKIVKELNKALDKLDEIIASIGTEIKDYNDIRSSTYVEEIIVIPKNKYIELLDLYDNLDDLKDRIDFNSWCKMDKNAYIIISRTKGGRLRWVAFRKYGIE